MFVAAHIKYSNLLRKYHTEIIHIVLEPRASLPPLLLKLSERRPESLDYIGVSFGITEKLLKFWKRGAFVPVYLRLVLLFYYRCEINTHIFLLLFRQTANDITGEHSCIMLYKINSEQEDARWLQAYWNDFRRRFISLLSFSFNLYPSSLALGILIDQ